MGTTKSAISRLESSLRTDKHSPMLFNAYELLFLPLTENWDQTPLIHNS